MSSSQNASDNVTGLKIRIKKLSPSVQTTDNTDKAPSMLAPTSSPTDAPPRMRLPSLAPSTASLTQPASTPNSRKRKAGQLPTSSNEDEQASSPAVKKSRFAKDNSITIVPNGDPANLPDTATFSYKFNGKLHKITSSRPMRSNSALTKRITVQNRHLLEFTVVDDDREEWSFKYADSDNADWDDNAWVEKANKWFHSVQMRCFGVEEGFADGEQKTNDQWSTVEITTLKSLTLTQMRRVRGTLKDPDWTVVAARFNLLYRGTTQPAGTVLASARGQALTASKPFVVTKGSRVLSGRSSKSLSAVLNRFLEKKLSVWQAEMLKEAKDLGWLDDHDSVDGYKFLFQVLDESAGPSDEEGVVYYKYETKDGEEVEVETDDKGNLVCATGGQRVLVLEEGDDDDTDEDVEGRRETIDEEVQRMLADPEILGGLASKSAVAVKAEHERILEKVEERRLRDKGKGNAVEEEAAEEEGVEEEATGEVDVEMEDVDVEEET